MQTFINCTFFETITIFVFRFASHLGLKLALLSDRFDVLVDAHFDGKSELTIWRPIKIYERIGAESKLSVLVDVANFVDFPFPDRPLPNKIRFKDLRIDYIDHPVFTFIRVAKTKKGDPNLISTFIRSNKPIWDRNGIKFVFDVLLYAADKQKQKTIWDVFVREIWPIFAPNIHHLSFTDCDDLYNLRRLISPTILTDLAQLTSIDLSHLLPDGIADDGRKATAGQALSKWLHTPSKNCQPKQLHCLDYSNPPNLGWINNFKETFLRATTSVAYNVRLGLPLASEINIVEQFELVNEVTQEKLTLIKEANRGATLGDCLLKRCPIVGETATAQQEKDENSDANLNGVFFHLYHDCIGPLSPPGQSDKKLFSLPGPSD